MVRFGQRERELLECRGGDGWDLFPTVGVFAVERFSFESPAGDFDHSR